MGIVKEIERSRVGKLRHNNRPQDTPQENGRQQVGLPRPNQALLLAGSHDLFDHIQRIHGIRRKLWHKRGRIQQDKAERGWFCTIRCQTEAHDVAQLLYEWLTLTSDPCELRGEIAEAASRAAETSAG